MMNKYLKANVKKLQPYVWEDTDEQIARQYNLNPDQLIRLDTNTPGKPPACYDEFLRIINDNRSVNEYTDFSYEKLKELIVDYEGIKTGQVVCGNSGDEMIDIIGKACLNQGDQFIISSPTYSVFQIQSEINGGVVLDIPLSSDWQIDDQRIIQATQAEDVKLVFICNPNNPTGTVSDVARIENVISQADALVVVDEAYREFYGQSVNNLIDKYDNLIVLRSFSKFGSLAGARVGYVLTNEYLARKLDALRFPMGIAYFSMELAKLVLQKDREYINKLVEDTIQERKRIMKLLREKSIEFFNSKANFILIKLPRNPDVVISNLKKAGMVVRDMTKKTRIENCIRVTIRDQKTNDKFIKTLFENV